MSESPPIAKKGFSIDWLVKGSLTKVGDIFDRLTGRGWKPSSSLATSELIEKMKAMMDAEVRESEQGRKFVPHNIRLKMQWDKFSTDAEEALRKLENEFLVAAVDHINDKHYFTHAPLSIEAKPDYFTTGVKLLLSFDKLEAQEREAELDVTLDAINSDELTGESSSPNKRSAQLKIHFVADGKPTARELQIAEGQRLTVGRTKENDVAIDDQSISKAHASLLLNKDGKLILADTGSTNGTFVRGERIPYGKAIELFSGDDVRFGLVKVDLKFGVLIPEKNATEAQTDNYKVGEFEFSSRTDANTPVVSDPPPTVASIPVRREAVTPIKTQSNSKPEAKQPAEDGPSVSPQPAVSEAKIDLDKEKQDWEV